MKKKDMIFGGIFIALAIIIDQIIKVIIRVKMDTGDSITLINHFFSITHVENTGAAWGGFSGYTIVLIIISLAILGYFIYLYKDINFKNKIVFSISLVLVIGGTIGNLIDRLIFRSVTDFLDFIILGYDFPVFNIADIFLVVGFALFIIDMIFLDKEVAKEVKEEEKKEIVEERVTEALEETNNIDESNESIEDETNEGNN